jgi:hypothetical protein
MKFGDDWRGLFIRGDSAFNFAMHLEHVLGVHYSGPICHAVLQELLALLQGTNEHAHPDEADVQRMKPFDEAREDGK